MIDTSLPLTDIHRHLDGNIRAQTILDLGRQFNLTLPAQTLETLIPHVQVTSNEPDLVSFLSKLDWGVKMLASWMPAAVLLSKTLKMLRVTACTTSNCVFHQAIWQ
jgi:adenosine deaminase